MSAPLLVEIGCEEIPARMIRSAAADLSARLVGILDQAGLAHGPAQAWGGSRRLAVRVDEVEGRQADREERVLGPPARAGFASDGSLTPAAVGFARKQGIDPSQLARVDTDKGVYLAFTREVPGRTLGEILAGALPRAVAGMAFPKSMRWGDGSHRWVRPVHWLLALYGEEAIPLELFGVPSGDRSLGHRFLSAGFVRVPHPDRYIEELREAFVLVDPEERRRRLAEDLRRKATDAGGEVLEDPALLDEVVDLVEWPGVVEGRFDEAFLKLPREILVTTLRHHQKCFSVHSGGRLLSVFLAVANTHRDPSGHVRRGNEWVVGGRLQDARFFWDEDRKVPLAGRFDKLRTVLFHRKCGSYTDKAERLVDLAHRIGEAVGLGVREIEEVGEAARLSKNDLTTGLVGEFPELQGIVGGLLLREEGRPEAVHQAVYEHYRPAAVEDCIPGSVGGCIVSVADRLDTVGQLIRAGEVPTGSRDPFGLRRALNGVFRIVEEQGWRLSLFQLVDLAGHTAELETFVQERYVNYLRERGYTPNEVYAVLRPQISSTEFTTWQLHDIVARLKAIQTVRGREDFEHLVDLTKRVDNIRRKGAEEIQRTVDKAADPYSETEPVAVDLETLMKERESLLENSSKAGRYKETVEIISGFIEPVDLFFDGVLIIDPSRPEATRYRTDLVARLGSLLTRYFDIRELAGQADRNP